MMFVCPEASTALLLLRAAWVDQGGTWGVPGGGIGEGYYGTPISPPIQDEHLFLAKAKQEVEEECGSLPPGYSDAQIIGRTAYTDCGFQYVTYIVGLTKAQKDAWRLHSPDNETDEFRWFPLSRVREGGRLDGRAVHFGVAFTLGAWQQAAANPRRARRNESLPTFEASSIYSPSFRDWFAGSKVVDAEGLPKVVYHGGDAMGFTSFDPQRWKGPVEGKSSFFFSDTPDIACTYAGDTKEIVPGAGKGAGLYKVYLRMRRPLIVDARGAMWDALDLPASSEAARFVRSIEPSAVDPDGALYTETDTLVYYASHGPYDGIIFKNIIDEGPFGAECGRTETEIAKIPKSTVYVVFTPNQIKSVRNRGTFDVNDPDIRHNPRRARRNMSDEDMQDVCQSVDYALMQDEDDIGRRFDRYGGRGYHDTSRERAAQIKRQGLGAHPGKTFAGGGGIEGHEVLFWLCAWAHPDVAKDVLARGERAGWGWEVSSKLADEISKHLAERYPNLKVVWFYRDEYGGGISKFAGSRCSFDLRQVVNWLSANASDGPYLFGDPDMGWCLAWDGPTIPPDFLEWVESNPQKERQPRKPRSPRRRR
jgi:ADP-ribose pyrophosphatase YjhB (NUDIX family)